MNDSDMSLWDEEKAVSAAEHFIYLEGGQINYMKLIKLLYLADRRAFARLERPITGDAYASLPHGPIVSRVYKRIKGAEQGTVWHQHVSRCTGYQVKAEHHDLRRLSEREVEILDGVYREFGHMDQFELRDWCHEHLAEWEDPHNSSKPITIERILAVLGKSPDDVYRITNELRAVSHMASVLGC